MSKKKKICEICEEEFDNGDAEICENCVEVMIHFGNDVADKMSKTFAKSNRKEKQK